MKNLYLLLSVALIVVFTSAFRMHDKSQKATLVAADSLMIEDSESANATKYTTMANVDTYLSAIYQPLTAHLTDLADGNITSNFVNETYPWADNEVADDLTIAKLQLDHNVETLAANKTLVITDKVIQKLDPDGTDRDVLLPAEATATDLVFFIYNMGGETGEDLTIQDDAAADILSVGYLQFALCTCDGATWVVKCLACAGAGDVIDLRAKEENTSAIVTGQPVYISGATGAAYPNVGLADCDDSSKIRARGLASEDISQNSTGYIRAKGLLEDVNSTKGSAVNPLSQDWTAGDQLWVSATAGGLTNVRPIGRNIKAGTALTAEGSSSKILVYPRESPIYTGAASGEDIIRQMGDSAGANKISYTDFAGNEVASLDSDGNATFTENVSAATYGSDSSITDAELLYINTLTSNAQDQFDARCLESVFGTSIGTGLLLDSAVLKASAILQKYHGVDPSANVLTMLGSDNNTVILSNIGAESDLVNEAGLYSALADVVQFYEPGDNVTIYYGTTPPTTCATGQFFCDTDEDTDGSLLLCVSTNTWKDIGMGPDKDKISEGDSSVEVIDAGTGQVDIDIDGNLKARINGTGLDVNGTVVCDGVEIGAVASPRIRALDSDSPGTDKFAGSIDWQYVRGGDGNETAWMYFKCMEDGSNTTQATYDGNVSAWKIPTGKHLFFGTTQWDNGSDEIDADAIDTIVESIVWNAAGMSADDTHCVDPTEVTINSGPKMYTIICADNDGSTMYGHVVMPDSWNAGTVTFELEYLQTAADTGPMHSDICAMCRGAGETVNNTWGSEVAIDDAAVTGSNAVDHTTSGAVTPNGTCAAGDTLWWRWQLDATGTTTAVATLHNLGMKMEYTSNVGD